jgi:signal recognition particle receptor subunit beta
MDSAESRQRPSPSGPVPCPAKILVVGGLGAGKTTFLRSVAGQALAAPTTPVPGGWGRPRKRVRHPAPLELGRITLDADLVLYLFSAARPDSGGALWDELAHGALGVVVLADPRHLEDAFVVLDAVDRWRLPFMVAVNRFGPMTHTANDIRDALAVSDEIPVMFCDARQPLSVKAVLRRLVRHTITRAAMPHLGTARHRRRTGVPLLTDRPHVSSRFRR